MTQEYWKDKISQWQASGKSMAEFCRHEDLSYWTFRDWKKRFSKQSESKLVKLNPEKLKTKTSPNMPLQISIKGINLTIPERYDEQHLIRLISTLRKLP